MRDLCCSLIAFHPVLHWHFLVCWVAEDIRGKEEGWPAAPGHRWHVKYPQPRESPVCFEGFLSGHKHALDINAWLHPSRVSLLEKGTGREGYYLWEEQKLRDGQGDCGWH